MPLTDTGLACYDNGRSSWHHGGGIYSWSVEVGSAVVIEQHITSS